MSNYDIFKNFDYRSKVTRVAGVDCNLIIVFVGDYQMGFQIHMNHSYQAELMVWVSDKHENIRTIHRQTLTDEQRLWLIEFRDFCKEIKDVEKDLFHSDNSVLDSIFG
jgi:hypothetical protein